MATISNTPRPGYIYDSTDAVWYPIGTGTHSHSEIASTIIDAKGDLIVGSAADTPIRKAVGTDGQMLYADSTVTGGIKWADAPASGGMTLLSTTSLSGATTTISSISQDYTDLYGIVYGVTNATGNGTFTCKINNTQNIYYVASYADPVQQYNSFLEGYDMRFNATQNLDRTNSANGWFFRICNYATSITQKPVQFAGDYKNQDRVCADNSAGTWHSSSAVTSLVFANSGGNLSTGTVKLYGVK